MAEPARPRICAAVLAAGQSKRFGKADKLAQPLGDTMLGVHICDALKTLDCSCRVVISSAKDHPCLSEWTARGFQVLVNPHAEEGLGGSVALAASYAIDVKADALLLCLADMPFVPSMHLRALIEYWGESEASKVVATHNGRASMPPAIFDAERLAELARLSGKFGARELLADSPTIALEPSLLRDIDTRAQLSDASRDLS